MRAGFCSVIRVDRAHPGFSHTPRFSSASGSACSALLWRARAPRKEKAPAARRAGRGGHPSVARIGIRVNAAASDRPAWLWPWSGVWLWRPFSSSALSSRPFSPPSWAWDARERVSWPAPAGPRAARLQGSLGPTGPELPPERPVRHRLALGPFRPPPLLPRSRSPPRVLPTRRLGAVRSRFASGVPLALASAGFGDHYFKQLLRETFFFAQRAQINPTSGRLSRAEWREA